MCWQDIEISRNTIVRRLAPTILSPPYVVPGNANRIGLHILTQNLTPDNTFYFHPNSLTTSDPFWVGQLSCVQRFDPVAPSTTLLTQKNYFSIYEYGRLITDGFTITWFTGATINVYEAVLLSDRPANFTIK